MQGIAGAERPLLSVPNVLLVARLFQALPRLTELKLAAPAAVLFAAIRFWYVGTCLELNCHVFLPGRMPL